MSAGCHVSRQPSPLTSRDQATTIESEDEMLSTTQAVTVNNDGVITSVATCACGALFYASERQADNDRVVTQFGSFPVICDTCHTSATDHSIGWADEEGRCGTCDMRGYRHR